MTNLTDRFLIKGQRANDKADCVITQGCSVNLKENGIFHRHFK